MKLHEIVEQIIIPSSYKMMNDISVQTNTSLNDWHTLYNLKIKQYIDRDVKNKKPVSYFKPLDQQMRAIKNITAYAVKKLDYKVDLYDSKKPQ